MKKNDTTLILLAAIGAGFAYWLYTEQAKAATGLPPGTGPGPGPGPGPGTYPGVPPVIPPVVPPIPPTPSKQWTLAAGLQQNLLRVQQQFGVKGAKGKEDRALATNFQAGEGLKPDGLSGPKTTLRMAQYLPTLPLVMYWPKGSGQKAVLDYKAELLRIASAMPPDKAAELRASAEREKGQSMA